MRIQWRVISSARIVLSMECKGLKMQRSIFKDVMLGDTFFYNGTLFRKKSSRTAWVSGLERWFYFGLTESVQIPDRY